MVKNSIENRQNLYEYLKSVSLREPDILRRLRDETQKMPSGGMQIAPDQGQFFAFLLRLMGARRVLEVGTFTGYSSLCMALALPADGRVITCDLSQEWTRVARRYWREGGVEDRIELKLGPGQESLARMLDSGMGATFDFAFIDADKEGYDIYYEQCLQLVRPGGAIAIDNVLWGGRVADSDVNDESTCSIRAVNRKLHRDSRVEVSMLPVGDGVYLAWKRL